jgi:hypothetical protein
LRALARFILSVRVPLAVSRFVLAAGKRKLQLLDAVLYVVNKVRRSMRLK